MSQSPPYALRTARVLSPAPDACMQLTLGLRAQASAQEPHRRFLSQTTTLSWHSRPSAGVTRNPSARYGFENCILPYVCLHGLRRRPTAASTRSPIM